jgi:hypothetical protein
VQQFLAWFNGLESGTQNVLLAVAAPLITALGVLSGRRVVRSLRKARASRKRRAQSAKVASLRTYLRPTAKRPVDLAPQEQEAVALIPMSLRRVEESLKALAETADNHRRRQQEVIGRARPGDLGAREVHQNSFPAYASAIDELLPDLEKRVAEYEAAVALLTECWSGYAAYTSVKRYGRRQPIYQDRRSELITHSDPETLSLTVSLREAVKESSYGYSQRLDATLDLYLGLLDRLIAAHDNRRGAAAEFLETLEQGRWWRLRLPSRAGRSPVPLQGPTPASQPTRLEEKTSHAKDTVTEGRPQSVRHKFSSTKVIEVSNEPGHDDTLNLDNIALMVQRGEADLEQVRLVLTVAAPLNIDTPSSSKQYPSEPSRSTEFPAAGNPGIEIAAASSTAGPSFVFHRWKMPMHVISAGQRKFDVRLLEVRDRSEKGRERQLIAYTFGISEQ